MPAYFEFFCPVKILSGNKALDHIPYELDLLGARRPLLLSDAGVDGAGLLRHVRNAFKESGVSLAAVCRDVPPDSSLETVREVAEAYRQADADAILAVGGGSVLDTAKGVNIVVSQGETDLGRLAGSGGIRRPLRPLVAVPTTAGTGSEVTSVAVITDTGANRKIPFSSPFLLPNVAVIDLRMTLTLPPRITAATGMDALTHAIEAYTCLGKNPMSDAYAVAAVKLIGAHLAPVTRSPDEREGRLALANASTMAGIAFSNSMTGMVHMLGHAVGVIGHLPHGEAMGILLPHVLDYNLAHGGSAFRTQLAELLLPFAGESVCLATPQAERAERFVASIRELKEALHEAAGLPRTLTETGSEAASRLEEIARLSLDEAAALYNPVEVEYEDALHVLRAAHGAG